MFGRKLLALSFSKFKRYTKSHQWVEFDPATKRARVGISHYAQGQIGDIIHVELPQINQKVEKGSSFASIESVKVAADIYSPGAGRVVENNPSLEGNFQIINKEAEKSWLSTIQIDDERDLNGLLTESEYLSTLKK